MDNRNKKLLPVFRNRLHETVAHQIRNKILSGEFAVGEKLPSERDISSALKVNRSTVREALKKLEILGLVEIRHGDGIYVRDYMESGNLELFKSIIYMDEIINPDVLKGILDVRKIVVPEMAYYAALNRTESELVALEKAIVNHEGLSNTEVDLKVHHIIARASRNLFYIFLLNFFNQVFRDFGFLYFSDPQNVKKTEKFHREISTAILKQDASKSRKLMKDVLLFTERKIYWFYEIYNKNGEE